MLCVRLRRRQLHARRSHFRSLSLRDSRAPMGVATRVLAAQEQADVRHEPETEKEPDEEELGCPLKQRR